jgi:hypothetical protein
MTQPSSKEKILREFDERFGRGYKDPLHHTVEEEVRDVHRAFLSQALSDRKAKLKEAVEAGRAEMPPRSAYRDDDEGNRAYWEMNRQVTGHNAAKDQDLQLIEEML